MLNVLLIRPGEPPAAVTVPENAVALTETAIRALIGASNTERHPGLWAGVSGDLYTDAKAVAQNMPVNDAATELRAAAIRQRNPASKDAAVLRGAALLVQVMPDPPKQPEPYISAGGMNRPPKFPGDQFYEPGDESWGFAFHDGSG